FILIHNALQYMDEGLIVIEAKEKEGEAYISVRDTGVGITEEYLAYIFNPYINDPKSFGDRNTGVDLFICQKLVHMHGGMIKAELVANAGSEFTFTMPIFDKNKANEASINVSQEPIMKKFDGRRLKYPNKTTSINVFDEKVEHAHVLIVDYDRLNITVTRNILSKDYEITIVNNAFEAIDSINENNYDIVISEIMLPGMSGLELVAE